MGEIYSEKGRRGLTPWSTPTVDRMLKERRIPMVFVKGGWAIARKAFREAAETALRRRRSGASRPTPTVHTAS